MPQVSLLSLLVCRPFAFRKIMPIVLLAWEKVVNPPRPTSLGLLATYEWPYRCVKELFVALRALVSPVHVVLIVLPPPVPRLLLSLSIIPIDILWSQVCSSVLTMGRFGRTMKHDKMTDLLVGALLTRFMSVLATERLVALGIGQPNSILLLACTVGEGLGAGAREGATLIGGGLIGGGFLRVVSADVVEFRRRVFISSVAVF